MIKDYLDVELKIAGTKDVSLVDVIGFPSFSVWFAYCNFRCPWCQNWPIVVGKNVITVKVRDLLEEIDKNALLINYVHVTGGEPTVQATGLEALFKAIKRELQLKTSLNTNGYNWKVIDQLLKHKLVDHIAMDIKAPFSRPDLYAKIIGLDSGEIVTEYVKTTVKLALKNISFTEFRTTLMPLLNMDDLIRIGTELIELGCNEGCYYVIQQFIPNPNAPDPQYKSGNIIPASKLINIAQRVKLETGLTNVYVRSMEEGVTMI